MQKVVCNFFFFFAAKGSGVAASFHHHPPSAANYRSVLHASTFSLFKFSGDYG